MIVVEGKFLRPSAVAVDQLDLRAVRGRRPGERPAFSEARYVPAWKVIAQKAMLEFAQEFVLEFTANLIVNAIVSAAQNKPFTG